MDLETLMTHETRLAQWKLRALGQALLVSAFGAAVFAALGAALDVSWLLALSPFVGLVVFGGILAGADAPKPPAYRKTA